MAYSSMACLRCQSADVHLEEILQEVRAGAVQCLLTLALGIAPTARQGSPIHPSSLPICGNLICMGSLTVTISEHVCLHQPRHALLTLWLAGTLQVIYPFI